MKKSCKDCLREGIVTNRPAPHPGPRCTSHHRIEKKRRKLCASEKRVEANFGLTPEQYDAIYEAQGGRCFICRVARGIVKRLAVDHVHSLCDDHPPEQGCPRCVRALLCGPCNQMIGRLGVEALQRAAEVLTDPPARKILHS